MLSCNVFAEPCETVRRKKNKLKRVDFTKNLFITLIIRRTRLYSGVLQRVLGTCKCAPVVSVIGFYMLASVRISHYANEFIITEDQDLVSCVNFQTLLLFFFSELIHKLQQSMAYRLL